MIGAARLLLCAGFAALVAGPVLAQRSAPDQGGDEPSTPQSLGFRHYAKCPSDADVDRLGDTRTAKACLAACEAHDPAVGCWWLDGSGGFPRECRVCRTMKPRRGVWPNDWAIPLSAQTS